MYRIRLHGRGGQGIKTASRMLGNAFFAEDYEVQDAPRYGAERRGAPIFAYVRASKSPIHERGVIQRADLVVVADDTLLGVAAAGVLAGIDEHTVLLIDSPDDAAQWRERLALRGPILALDPGSGDPAEQHFLGAACAGAAARLVGVIRRDTLDRAIRLALEGMSPEVTEGSTRRALAAYDRFAEQAGCVVERAEEQSDTFSEPSWIEIPLDPAARSAPEILSPANSVQVRTGLWRTMRPVIDHEHCHRCAWICGTLCPDRAIELDAEGWPQVDYDHCKGCLVCVAVCPPHAIRAVREREADAEQGEERS